LARAAGHPAGFTLHLTRLTPAAVVAVPAAGLLVSASASATDTLAVLIGVVTVAVISL